MRTYLPILLSLFIVLFGCKNSSTENENTTENPLEEIQKEKEEEAPKGPIILTAIINDLRVRDKPGTDGAEVARLTQGSKLYYEDEMSEFTTKIRLRGIQFDDPWLKISTNHIKEGWIYAGGVKFDVSSKNALTEQLVTRRLKAFFGRGAGDRISIYQDLYAKMNKSKDFASTYQMGLDLREELSGILERKIDIENDAYDLFWVGDVLPGMLSAVVAEGTEYYLFLDYNDWLKKAKATAGTEDDNFVDLNLQIYPDSIEYFFKNYYLQTWDYGGSSLLGEGEHTKVLNALEKLETKTQIMFKAEIDKIKADLVRDITTSESYWRQEEDIMNELDNIIQHDYNCLSNKDKADIKARKTMLADAKNNNIVIDARGGTE